MASKTLFCTKGAFYESSYSLADNLGMYALWPPLVSPVTPLLFTAATMTKRDISVPQSFLDGEKLFYNFGKAWGDVVIEGEILLGNSSVNSVSDAADTVITSLGGGLRLVELYYNIFRASVYKKPIILTSLRYAEPVNFFLHEYTRGPTDNEFNTVRFALKGFVLEPPADGILEAAKSTFRLT